MLVREQALSGRERSWNQKESAFVFTSCLATVEEKKY